VASRHEIESSEDLIRNMYIPFGQTYLSLRDAFAGVVCPGASRIGDAEVPH
jgi:hypothetical protein